MPYPKGMRRCASAIVLLLLASGSLSWPDSGPGEAHEGHRHDATSRHGFDDVEHWVRVFDDADRDAWQRPDHVIEFLGIGPGQTVADLGAGTGYFTVLLARAVGSEGRVWAVDIEPALIEHLRGRAAEADLPQVRPVLAESDDPGLPRGGVDVVLIVNTWHHIDDRLRYLGTLGEALKPGGRVAVVDFREGELPVGPPPGHKLSRDEVVGEFREAGWLRVSESEELPYQYLLVFRPPSHAGGNPIDPSGVDR